MKTYGLNRSPEVTLLRTFSLRRRNPEPRHVLEPTGFACSKPGSPLGSTLLKAGLCLEPPSSKIASVVRSAPGRSCARGTSSSGRAFHRIDRTRPNVPPKWPKRPFDRLSKEGWAAGFERRVGSAWVELRPACPGRSFERSHAPKPGRSFVAEGVAPGGSRAIQRCPGITDCP